MTEGEKEWRRRIRVREEKLESLTRKNYGGKCLVYVQKDDLKGY